MVAQAELILRVITLWFLVLSQFFRDGMGAFKNPQLTYVNNYKLPAFLSLPVYFSFFNFKNDQLRSYYQMP